ncbi:MAG: ROK family protein, partial [Solirubrobacteraceae bacterium]
MSTGCVIGVDLGGTKLLAGAVDRALNVHHRATRPARGTDQAAVLDAVVGAVREVRDAIEGESQTVAAVGFGIPCLIDQERGVAVMAVNLPLANLPFRDLMAERLGLPVFVDNDANGAMLAEWRFGAAAGARDVALLALGTG